MGTALADVNIQAQYLGQFFLPVRLSAYYPSTSYSAALDPAFFYALSALLALAAALIHWRGAVLFVAGMLWWFISLAPVANFYPIYNPMAERYLYLPSIGLCLWAGWVLARGLESARRRPLLVVIALAAIAMAITTWQRNPVWHDNVTLWSATAHAVPDDPTVLANLAAAHYEHQEYDQVIACATRALELAGPHPVNFEPAGSYLPLGCALYVKGDKDRALQYFHAAEQRVPLRFDLDSAIYRNLALAYDDRGDYRTAAGYYAKALAIDPFRPQDWAKFAYAQLRIAQPAAAREAWDRARKLNAKLPAYNVFEAAVAQDTPTNATAEPGPQP
jgi:protein O-mannosyl-transferase